MNFLDEAESPQNYRNQIPQNSRQPTNREFDCGSVSSGSDKDEGNIKVFEQKPAQMMNVTHRHHETPIKFSPDNEDKGFLSRKEPHGYNSSKLVPNFEPIMKKEPSRMSPDKYYDRNYQPNMMSSQIHEMSHQPFGRQFMNDGNMYQGHPNFNSNYHQMPMNPVGNHFHPQHMPPYNMYQPNMMYGHPVMYGHGQVGQPMKAQSANLLTKHTSLTDHNIPQSKTSKMMVQIPGSMESKMYAQNISHHHGPPGIFEKGVYPTEPSPMKTVKTKQMSSPIVVDSFKGLAPNSHGRQSDSNLVGRTREMSSATLVKSEVKNPGKAKSNLAAPVPMEQKSKVDQPKSSPVVRKDTKKKSKGKKSKNTEKRKRERLSGRLKFFDEGKKYGFFVLDEDEQDLFVHYDDLKKVNISREVLASSKDKHSIRFTFNVFEYYDSNKKLKTKAIDIKLVSIHKIDPSDESEIPEPVL